MFNSDFFQLDETLQAIKKSAHSFCQSVIAPVAEEVDKKDAFPSQLWEKIGQMGFHGITVSEEDGGAGLGYLAHALVAEEISRASGSVGISYIAHSNLCVNQLRLNGNLEQKKKFLPDLISGKKIGALAMSEAGAGSDVVGMSLKAVREDNHYTFNGSKLWITNGYYADTFVVYAKTSPEAGKNGITAFIVEKGRPGFSQSQKLDKLGMRGSGTCELVFQNCKIPQENILGEENKGVKVLMGGLDYERIIAAAAPVGLMQAALDIVLPYVRERKQFGRPIGDFQLMQAKVADMVTLLNASRSYLYITARAADCGLPLRGEAASLILFNAENATRVALEAIQALGGNGYINEYPTGRILRDAKLYEIGAGTSEIRRMLIGRELIGKIF